MWTMDDDLAYTLRLVEEYKSAKLLAVSSKARAAALKKELSDLVDAEGYEGDNGHLWYEVGDYKLKRERRVSKSFDLEECEQWARSTGLWDEVKEVVESVSEDKVLALAWDDLEVREAIERFYKEKETWAFKL